MADSRGTGSPEWRQRDADSYFTNQAAGRQSSSRPGFERQTTAPLRTQLASIRSPGSPGPTSPGAPRTPILNRSFSSPFASPRADFTAGDEIFVLEFGSRYLRLGFGGEKRPRCVVDFGPGTQSRAGDYSRWLPGHAQLKAPTESCQESWGSDYELWDMDVKRLDLGLIRDKIERAVREAMAQHVLIVDDSRKRSHVIAVPAQMPQPLLHVVLDALFSHMPAPPSIFLLSAPTANLVASGLRSGLVVDIGWQGTTVTAVYEYREVKHARSVRGMKTVHWQTALLLKSHLEQGTPAASLEQTTDGLTAMPISFKDSEDVVHRLLWCAPTARGDDLLSGDASNGSPLETKTDRSIEIPLITSAAPSSVRVPVTAMSQPIEIALFANGLGDHRDTLDDHDLPLSTLVYRTLLHLSLDLRETLLHRIVVTGGGANIPGLKVRLLNDLNGLVQGRGWDPVHNYGSIESKIKAAKAKVKARDSVKVTDPGKQSQGNKDVNPASSAPAHLQDPLPDPILDSLRSRNSEQTTQTESMSSPAANVHGVDTLGAWAGLSLMAGLRVKSAVEIERETFLQYGLIGAPERSEEDEVKRKRQSMMPSQLPQAKSGDRGSGTWSLGVFG